MIGRQGNALFFILIAVALFAALSYAITQSTRGSGDITREQLQLFATSITDYGTEIAQAINRMILINGCRDTEISFDNPFSPSGRYTNSNSPLDLSCHVFEPSGGGVQWRNFPDIEFDANYGRPRFATGDGTGSHKVRSFGTDDLHDLFMVIRTRSVLVHPMNQADIDLLCDTFNNSIGITDNTLSFYEGAFAGFFTGDYGDSAGVVTGNGETFSEYPYFCTNNGGSTTTYFIFPLLLR